MIKNKKFKSPEDIRGTFVWRCDYCGDVLRSDSLNGIEKAKKDHYRHNRKCMVNRNRKVNP